MNTFHSTFPARVARRLSAATTVLLPALLAAAVAGCSTMGMTPLQAAVYRGNKEQVQELLDKGSSVNEWNYGTPLMTAAGENRLEVARLLIDRGANLDGRAQVGYSALGLAARQGHGEMVDLLIVKGADIDQAVKGLLQWSAYVAGPPYPDAATAAKIKKGIDLIYRRAGMAYFNAAQYEKAANIYRSKAEANPTDPENFSMLAASCNRLGRHDEARAAAESAVKLAPDNAPSHLAFANSLMSQEDWAAAVAALSTAVRLDPRNAYGHKQLGYALWNTGNQTEAIGSFRKAAELDTEDIEPLYALMHNCAYSGRLDEAIAAAGRILEKQPEDRAEILGFRSFLYRGKGMGSESARDAQNALAVSPGHTWALFSTAVLALDRGNCDEAIRLLMSINEKERGIRASLFEALAHARKGDLEKAERAFAPISRKVSASRDCLLATDSAAVLGLLKPVFQAHLDRAGTLEVAGEYRSAVDEYAMAFRIAAADGAKAVCARVADLLKTHSELLDLPEEARKHYVRGEMLVKEKKFKQARSEFEAALDLAPCVPAAYYSAAQASAELKQFDQAVRHMNSYLELLPHAPNAREAKDSVYRWQFMIERQSQGR